MSRKSLGPLLVLSTSEDKHGRTGFQPVQARAGCPCYHLMGLGKWAKGGRNRHRLASLRNPWPPLPNALSDSLKLSRKHCFMRKTVLFFLIKYTDRPSRLWESNILEEKSLGTP